MQTVFARDRELTTSTVEPTTDEKLPHIEKMMLNLPDDVTDEQRVEIRALLYEFTGSFPKDDYDVVIQTFYCTLSTLETANRFVRR